MENKLDFESFKPLFGDWADMFRPFIESKEMWEIYEKIRKDARTDVIVPDSDVTFRAFATTNPDDIKSIWYLMDPFPRQYKKDLFQATGIALDCSNSPEGKLQPSLIKFYDAIEEEYGEKVERSANLEYLHKQGVMLLNTDLTCKLNKTGSHIRLWEPFQKFFLEEIMGSYSGIIYVLAGDESKRMERYIYPMNNYIFKISHPASAEHNRTKWDSQGIFRTTNKLIAENNGEGYMIYWNKFEYENPPF